MTQQSKNKLLAGTLLVLIAAASAMIWSSGEGEQIDKNIFRVDNLTEIDKVTFQSKGEVIELSFNGSRWLVNQSYDADDQMVTVLFATLQQVEVKRSVAAGLADAIANRLRQDGVKVTLYAGAESELEIYVGGNVNKTEAYIMDMNNRPFVMNIPGYRVYAAGVFELDQNGWREKRIFNFNWRNFKKLKAQFADPAKKGFEIEDQGFGFDITNTTGTDTTKLNDYLDAISLLMAERYIVPGVDLQLDSLLLTQPELTIEVLDLGRNKLSLDLYTEQSKDGEVVGRLNGLEGVIFDPEQVLPLKRDRDYFLLKHP